MDPRKHNRQAWDQKVEEGSPYTKPVSRETIEKSKAGEWEISVTTEKKVPRHWFPESIKGLNILCLASGGGQQGPILAAAGANVTVLDLSSKQLQQDERVAKENGLSLQIVQGDMTDLSHFAEESFDLIVHPVANLFIENVRPVWREASRVLKDRGIIIAGFTNPLLWLFDEHQEMNGVLDVAHQVPSSTLDHLSEEAMQAHIRAGHTIEFAHTLEDQIQGQLDAGFVISGFFEDDFGGTRLIDSYINTFIATRAIKVQLD